MSKSVFGQHFLTKSLEGLIFKNNYCVKSNKHAHTYADDAISGRNVGQ